MQVGWLTKMQLKPTPLAGAGRRGHLSAYGSTPRQAPRRLRVAEERAVGAGCF